MKHKAYAFFYFKNSLFEYYLLGACQGNEDEKEGILTAQHKTLSQCNTINANYIQLSLL